MLDCNETKMGWFGCGRLAGSRLLQLHILDQMEIFAHGEAEDCDPGFRAGPQQSGTCGSHPGTVKVGTTAAHLLRLQQTQMFLSLCPFSHSLSLPSETEKRQSCSPVLSCFISSVTLLFTRVLRCDKDIIFMQIPSAIWRE